MNYDLHNKFTAVVWSAVGDECVDHPADAFEEAVSAVFEMMEEEEVEELIERFNRNLPTDEGGSEDE